MKTKLGKKFSGDYKGDDEKWVQIRVKHGKTTRLQKVCIKPITNLIEEVKKIDIPQTISIPKEKVSESLIYGDESTKKDIIDNELKALLTSSDDRDKIITDYFYNYQNQSIEPSFYKEYILNYPNILMIEIKLVN
jgi:hypothetical protein